MKPQKSIQLKFDCQEDLESMSCTEKGKFCTACQKEVFDFTKKSYLEIQRIREEQPETCGIFLAEQLDPSLRPIQLPKVKSWAFLSSILVSLNFGNVSAQIPSDSKSEQLSISENALISSKENRQTKTASEQSSQNNIESAEMTPFDRGDRQRKRQNKKYRRKQQQTWYWSWRFPFVHKKPTRTYGVPRWL